MVVSSARGWGRLVKSYIRLSRPFTLAAPLLGGVLFAWWGAVEHGAIDIIKIIVVGVTLAIANYIGNVLNQVGDKEIDASHPVKRHRPIPSGEVSVEGAMSFVWVLTVLALGLGWWLSPLFGVLLSIILMFAFLYSMPPLRLRNRFILGNLSIGVPRGGLGVLTAYSAFSNPFENLQLLGIALAFAVYVFCVNTLKDYGDKEADASHGVRNFITVLGELHTSAIVGVGFLIPWVILLWFVDFYSYMVFVALTFPFAMAAIITLAEDPYLRDKSGLMWVYFYAYFMIMMLALILPKVL